MKPNLRLALALAVLTPSASAQLIAPISQDRFVDARASVNFGAFVQDLRTAPGFAPFTEAATATRSAPGGLPMSSANASQTSVIGPDSITAAGTIEAITGGGISDAIADSRCTVEFTVSQPVRYRLSGALESTGIAVSYVQLRGIGNSVDLSQRAQFGLNLPFDFSGVLLPGSYRFTAYSSATAQDGLQVGGSFDSQLDLNATTSIDCVPTNNSGGTPMLINTSSRAWPNSFFMSVTGGVGGGFGLMLYGQPQSPSPLGDGVLCVGQPLIRFPSVVSIDGTTPSSVSLSITQSPFDSGPGAITYGSQWTFQLWYRDSGSQASGFNLSNTLTVTFIP